ncbi:HdeD family acid-resistance protein [Albibacillus kandeliae]|jgi:uncharacterized membrane protein HdeD (DUF308 family)|uniref:HdeD family acid-resistance protein n=1 Tax=Albibacillus kandeliae TaxID=2174228 RepID=UPI000D69B092|nr:DUF308 domain-containing protein [Albibacillus kandeliae]
MKASTLMIVMGALLLLGGILALANPFAASITVTTLVGAFFLVAGIIQAWALFQDKTAQHRMWNGVVALLTIIAGVWLLANPLKGMVSLTIIVGALFFVMGLVRIMLAFQLRGSPLFWLLLLSGVASVLIGAFVFSDFASAATTLLGVLLGIQLLAEGVGLIALGYFARKI